MNRVNLKLKTFLLQLKEGEVECLEYGLKENNPDSFQSYLKIRYINTAGGMQFGLKHLHHGIEGSGFYTPQIEEMLKYAEERVNYFNRPTPFKEKFDAFRVKTGKPPIARCDYVWFPAGLNPGKHHAAALERLAIDRKLSKTEVVFLSL